VSEIDDARVRTVHEGTATAGPVLYWMNRDQRLEDNWALLYAQQRALVSGQPLVIAACADPARFSSNERQMSFMLAGLIHLQKKADTYGIPTYVFPGDTVKRIVQTVRHFAAGTVVTDFSPLRKDRENLARVAEHISIPVYEVDAHNIVPCRTASDKREYGAYTIRPRINRQLGRFLTEFPPLRPHPHRLSETLTAPSAAIVPQTISPLPSGSEAAMAVMQRFMSSGLTRYFEHRNNPVVDAQSGLSPYLHFGQLAAQRVALEAQRVGDRDIKPLEAFLEQLIVRRELSDNFCLHTPEYDSFEGFPSWAQASHLEHRGDPRSYLYSPQQFETADTHDPLWNAAQSLLVSSGRMHGYMRMYWAKKILEWSATPEQALVVAIDLNDRFALDGNDSNGYTGIAWSIGGVHDRPWFERDIFGKVRYMSESGCRRKFDVKAYIASAAVDTAGVA